MLLVFFLAFSLNTRLSFGADTISANQSLSGDQTIVSAGGNFELGFYAPGNPSKYYICMWYKKVSTRTVAWVANRESPVSDNRSSQLKIIDGNLVLLNERKLQVWSTNQSSTTSNSVVAVLGDDGNLVLREGSKSDSTEPIWQSFDHPTDTWLPGAKISYNWVTKTHQRLTSWKNSEDPAPGLFSLSLDANKSEYLIRRNGTEPYWTSGPWNGQTFSSVPELKNIIRYKYNFSFIHNKNESYFTYFIDDPSIISRFIMDTSGQVKGVTWVENSKAWNLFWSQPQRQCEVYDLCGAFGTCDEIIKQACSCLKGFRPRSDSDWKLNDHSGGCVRNSQLQCETSGAANKERDRFWKYPDMNSPENAQTVAVGSEAECETSCLGNCSCTAYAYDSNACSIWIGELVNVKLLSGNGKTLYIKLAASEFSSSKNNKGTIIGAVAGSIVVIALLGVVFAVFWRRQRRSVGSTKAAEGSLIAFGYRDLQHATKNFSEKLGGGGFGSVFKGTLPDSTVVAVKKLESIIQGEKQFRTEVSTIGTIQHINLVWLRGFCSEGNRKLVVYDYMQNGSLNSHLFHEKDEKVLDWKTRYQIVLGTARGLAYLHEKCRDCIIHCDIKPENILLDVEFCPKVADFGLAKLMGREFSRVLTTVRGTRGYLAPEWISGVAITSKADVFSYGMMLFEVVSGRRNSGHTEEGKQKFFPTWAANVVVEGGDVLDLLDPRLDKNADAGELRRICRVACWCIQDNENHRPTMGQVVQILEGILDVNPPPVPRSLQFFVDNQENIVFFTESSSGQSSEPPSNTSTDSSQAKSPASSTDAKP
ncbi:G-type lectin S-receptor-like serine/threonine-protein kinase At2g19130 isoform X2 [Diospyros lotus]|uniref:G-type lectin S-receptor-like serine/threonine-protein kinase At2g19130 isoform X2 n=1 Tax=Diospyros lotus TaxID=55363 RepID=UPI00224D7C52|nr:G-type lectin S-receptor-like serine/threonine-protein kinase At2g19130 isoform X2 [Diospyros lotus]